MCGVAGWVDFAPDAGQDRAVLDSMVATMANRGPDGTGTWLGPHAALGQRRLAVIDVEGGRQPMTAAAGPGRPPVVLVHAGEVYNFRELRAELAGRGHRFVTRSDTEVVLRAYLEWGEGCAGRLDGMFGFALWDPARETLLLARDRLGIKPLYYLPRPAGVLFSSEPKALFAHPSFRPEVDEQLLPILLNPRLALPGETPLRGLRELSPGHVLRVDRDGCHERRYWGLVSREHPDDLPATVRTVRELLAEAVRKQLVADVPVGTLLSGGLDSTALTALAARDHHGPLSTFAVDFAGDEQDFRPTALRPERDAPYAALAAKHLGTEHHNVVLDPEAVARNTEAPLRARDLPTHGQFDGSAQLLFRAVRERVTVALSGEGADELFGGYPWLHRPDMIWRDTFPWLGDAPRLTDCLAPDVRARVRPREAELDRYATLRARVPRLPGEGRRDARMREVLFLGLHGPLAYLLDDQRHVVDQAHLILAHQLAGQRCEAPHHRLDPRYMAPQVARHNQPPGELVHHHVVGHGHLAEGVTHPFEVCSVQQPRDERAPVTPEPRHLRCLQLRPNAHNLIVTSRLAPRADARHGGQVQTYRSLFGVREFRALFVTQCLTMGAASVGSLALGTIIYSSTGSPVLSALAMFGGPLVRVAATWFFAAASDLLRPRQALTAVAVVTVTADGLQAIPDLAWWFRFVLLALPWIVMSATAGSMIALVSDIVPRENFVFARSTMNIAVGVMQIVGYGLGGILLLSLRTTQLFMCAAGAGAVALVIIRAGVGDHPPRAAGPTIRRSRTVNRQLVRSPVLRPVLLALSVPNGLIVGCEAMFVPFAGHRAGYLFAATAAGMLLGDIGVGRFLGQRIRDRLVEPLRILLAAPYLVFLIDPTVVVAAAIGFVASIGYSASLPLQERLVTHTSPAARGQVLGLNSTAMMAMQGVGAVLAGVLAQVFGATSQSAATAAGIMAATSLAVTAGLTPGLRRSRPGSSPGGMDNPVMDVTFTPATQDAINRARRHSYGDLLHRTARRDPGKLAVVAGDLRVSFAEFDVAANRCAHALAAHGLAKGDRLALLSHNCWEYVVLVFATARLGVVLVPVNFMLGADEIAYILRHCGAKGIIAEDALAGTADQALQAAGVADPLKGWIGSSGASPAPGWRDIGPWWREGPEHPPQAEVGDDDPLRLMYTSGTESVPKGVMISSRSLIAQYVSCTIDGGMSGDDIELHSLPMYHCAQLDCFFSTDVYLGATSVILPGPDPAAILAAIEREKVTKLFSPPTVWISLLRHPDFDATDLSSLRKGYYGASPMPVEVLRELQRRLPGVQLWNFYGQTEMAPLATILRPHEQLERAGSAGRASLNVETRLVDDEDKPVPPGEIGEIVHRSPHAALGYYHDEAKTADTYRGGWFHSGDLGVMTEDGYLSVVDRKKDMIKTGGENVASREVEEAIYELDGVAEVAVFGIAHPHWIEAVTAVIVPKAGVVLTEEEVQAHAKARLAGFKRPKYVVFTDALPKNPSGKILKRDLRQRHARLAGGAS